MKLMINDWLTISRIILTPFILVCFYSKNNITLGIFLYAFSAISDFLDGYLARILKTESKFGKVMDPIADKWLAISLLLMFTHMQIISGYNIISVYLILFREISVMGMRTFSKTQLISSSIGKIKTSVLLIAIGSFLLSFKYPTPFLYQLGNITLNISALLSMISGLKYFLLFKKELNNK